MTNTLMTPPRTNADTPRSRSSSPASIWQNAAFCRLWASETISLFGTEITVLALPLTAILTLKATAFEVGLLDTLAWLPYLLFSLVLGVWVDQHQRRPLMILANLLRAALVVLIPIAWISHRLTLPLLYGVAFSAGVLSVIFNFAYQAYVPILLPQEQILTGNSKLQISASSAKIAGPGIAGVLIQCLSAPLAIVIDGISFVLAGLIVVGITLPEPLPQMPRHRRSLWQEVHEGLHYTFRHPHLRALTGMASTYNLAEQILLTLWIVYASKQGITPAWLGGILAVGSGGALGGSLMAGALLRKLGMRTALRWAIATSATGLFLIPLAGGTSVVMSFMLALAFGINGAGLSALNIYVRSIRQQTVPAAMMGRVLASYTCFSMGAVPIGAFLAGTLSLVVGIRSTLVGGALIALFAIPWIWNLIIPTTLANPKARHALSGALSRKIRITRRLVRPLPRALPQQSSRT